jgi:hypothetical protein
MGCVDRSYKRIIVSVGCGRAEMEMHSCDLHICLDIDKYALFCAKIAMRYLFRKKGNIILQQYNMIEGLSHILTQIQDKLTTVELLVLFQHTNPSEKRIVCDVSIKGIMECLEMCFMEIVASVHFVYDWHPNKNCWKVNELKTLIMDNSNIKLLGCMNFSRNRSITIHDSSLVDHPLQGVVERHGWAQMKRGDEQTFGVTKNI